MAADDEKLQRFLQARDAGDTDEARRWWDELVTDNFDRIRGMVRARRLSPQEQDDALQTALIALSTTMIHGFRGSSIGAWIESARALVAGADAGEETDETENGRLFLDWAITQLTPKRRAVLELDRAGVPIAQIQERLGVSREVVHTARSRGLRELVLLRARYGA